jgi:hypothetical protein
MFEVLRPGASGRDPRCDKNPRNLCELHCQNSWSIVVGFPSTKRTSRRSRGREPASTSALLFARTRPSSFLAALAIFAFITFRACRMSFFKSLLHLRFGCLGADAGVPPSNGVAPYRIRVRAKVTSIVPNIRRFVASPPCMLAVTNDFAHVFLLAHLHLRHARIPLSAREFRLGDGSFQRNHILPGLTGHDKRRFLSYVVISFSRPSAYRASTVVQWRTCFPPHLVSIFSKRPERGREKAHTILNASTL